MDHNKIRRKNLCYSLQAPTKFVSRKGGTPPAKAGVRKNNYSYGNNPKKDQEGRKEGYGSQASETNFLCFCIIITPFFVSRQANCLSRSPACLRDRKDIIGGGKGNSVVTRGQSKKRAGTKLRTMGEKENKR